MPNETLSLEGLTNLLDDLSIGPIPEQNAAEVLVKPVEIWRGHLTSLLSPLVDADPATIREAINSTADPSSLGDLVLVLPKLRLEGFDKDGLKALGGQLSEQLSKSPLFLRPWVEDPQIRILISPLVLPRVLIPYISDRALTYGHDPSQGLLDAATPDHARKRIVVEFSSPNIARDFDGNHLRSTLLGAFVANIYAAMGWEVERLNYLGDWGKQIGLLGVGFEKFGSEEKLQQSGIDHLLEVNAQINELFRPEEEAKKKAKQDKQSTLEIEGKGIFAERDAFFSKMERGDETAIGFWKRVRDITIDDLTSGYTRLGVTFDNYSGESQAKPETILEVETTLKDKGVLTESDGSWIIDFDKHGGKKGLGTTVLRGRDGATRYFLRDMATVLDRYRQYNFDKMIYVVASRQGNYFQQLFTAMDLMGFPDIKEKLQHVGFGTLQGLEAQVLSRVLDECAEKMRQVQQEAQNGDIPTVTDAAVVSALLTQIMSGKRSHGYVLEPKKMVDTGTMHTWHVKLMAKIHELEVPDVESAEADYDSLQDDDSVELLRLLAQFPDAVAATYRTLEPHTLLSYLVKVAGALYMCFGEDEEEEDANGEAAEEEAPEETVEQKKARLMLYQNARLVVENGMRLLGFPVA